MPEPTTDVSPVAGVDHLRAFPNGVAALEDNDPVETSSLRRPWLFEAGLILIVVGAPLVFLPMSAGPFADLKVVVVLAGALALWAGGAPLDRRLAAVAAVWTAVIVLSALVGVDRWWSLLGPENNGTGLIVLGPCAYLLVAGASVPPALARKIPVWLLGTTAVVSTVALIGRFAPHAFATALPNVDLTGSTLGEPVFLAGMCAIALAAAAAIRVPRRVWFALGVVVVASGLSISTKRAGLVALAAGLLVAYLRSRGERRHVLTVSALIAAVLVAWPLIGTVVEAPQPFTAAGRFSELGTDSARARVIIHQVMLRAMGERPVLGWGPGNAWGAYLSNASVRDVELARRGVQDAHDIVLQVGVGSGLLGVAALVALMWAVVRRARRAPPAAAWAAAAAMAAFVFHLLQPLNVALTPLLFLLAGVAASSATPAERPAEARPAIGIGRALVGAALVAGLLLSGAVLAASVLEQWGRTHNSTWALRASLSLVSGRVTPVADLAAYLAQDGTHDPQKATEARTLVEDAVQIHPYNPDVRLVASETELLLNDRPAAQVWLQRQVASFPGDVAWFPDDMLEFLRTGSLTTAYADLQSATADADGIG